MSDLRSKIIRLAHQQPHLRPQLLPLLKAAGNLGEELNPYLLEFDKVPASEEDMEEAQENLDNASNDLQGIVEDTSRNVAALVKKALRESGKFNKFFSGGSAELFHDDLIASVISAVHNAK
jgi:hypothetical protein